MISPLGTCPRWYWNLLNPCAFLTTQTASDCTSFTGVQEFTWAFCLSKKMNNRYVNHCCSAVTGVKMAVTGWNWLLQHCYRPEIWWSEAKNHCFMFWKWLSESKNHCHRPVNDCFGAEWQWNVVVAGLKEDSFRYEINFWKKSLFCDKNNSVNKALCSNYA